MTCWEFDLGVPGAGEQLATVRPQMFPDMWTLAVIQAFETPCKQ